MESLQQPKNNKAIAVIVLIILLMGVVLLAFYFLNNDFPSLVKQPEAQKEKQEKSNNEMDNVKDRVLSEAENARWETVSPIDENDHYLGSLEAPVQLIVYNDFDCAFCADYYEILNQVHDYFKDDVVIAYRHYPLNFNVMAYPAALASECAAEQGKFWEIYDKLFQANQNNELNEIYFTLAARELELDIDEFGDCYEAEEYKEKIEEQIRQADNFGVTGAPSTFINSEPQAGAVQFEDFVDSQGRQRQGLKTIIETKLRN